MTTQLLFSDLMAAAAVVASSSASSNSSGPSAGLNTASSSQSSPNSVLLDYGARDNSNGGNIGSGSTKTSGNYLEDQRALQLAFELSMLNNNSNGSGGGSSSSSGNNSSSGNSAGHVGGAGGATDVTTNGGVSNSSSMSSSSSNDYYLSQHQHHHNHNHHHHQQSQSRATQNGAQTGNNGMDSNGHDYENMLQHFLSSGNHEPVLNNLGSSSSSASQHYQSQQQISYDDMALEKFLLTQGLSGTAGGSDGTQSNGGDYLSHRNHLNGHQQHHQQQSHHHHSSTTTLNNLINGISSMNLNNLNGSVHGYSNGNGGGGHGGNGGNGGLMNETERFKKSQNMTECVPVPSSEHVAEIVGRQGCKIKALRAKTNTYIKTPVRGEEPVFVVTGRKEDVAKAKKEILSAAEHFSLIRASRKPSLTNASAGSGGSVNGVNSMAGSPLLSAASGNNCLGDIFSASSSGDDSPSILTKNPIGLTSAAAAAAASGHNQITVQVRVPYRVVGLVVGPKGATIKNIQQQTHTYIVTPSRDKEPIFEVTGAVENVEIARQQIEAHIAMRTGGNSESTDNLSNYLNSMGSGRGASMDMGMKKELQDELQLLNENFGQSTNFLRKYLNSHTEDQSQDYGRSFHNGQDSVSAKQQQQQHQSSANLVAMELLMSQLYNQDSNQVSSGLNEADIPSSVDLFGNRIRIDELLQSMQQQQKHQQQNHHLHQQQQSNELKRESDSHLLMARNMFSADYGSSNSVSAVSGLKSSLKSNDYYGAFAGDSQSKIAGPYGTEDNQGLLRRQLMSNNSEDDEGVGLELQESSPPNTNTNLMKMIMDGSEEDKKYLWSTLSAAVVGNPGGASTGGVVSAGSALKVAAELMTNTNHSSDSSCLSSASPSPTLSKFFTFQNGSAASASGGQSGNGGSGNKDRAPQEVELAAQLM